jgi:hypothetical protein
MALSYLETFASVRRCSCGLVYYWCSSVPKSAFAGMPLGPVLVVSVLGCLLPKPEVGCMVLAVRDPFEGLSERAEKAVRISRAGLDEYMRRNLYAGSGRE